MQDTIFDNMGRVMGYVQTTIHGDKVVFDKNNRRKGMYQVNGDYTLDESNRRIGRGDQTMRLLNTD